jgi:putative transposase
MAGHVFSEIFLHFNWHTVGDEPSLNPNVETFAHNFIRNRCRQTKGIFFEEINGTETHVHLVVRLEPAVNIGEFIGEIKGSSSFETNKHLGRKVLLWQRGYGVVSFGRKQLEWVREYVRNQKEHHRKGTIIGKLERTEELPEGNSEQDLKSPAEAG